MKATAHTNIESPASMPFVMVANLRYTQNKQAVTGKLILGWAAPNLYREEFNSADFQQTIVNVSGKLYRQRSAEAMPQAVEMWSRMIARPLHWELPQGARAKASNVPGDYQSSAALTCIAATNNGTRERICLDPANYEPLTYDVGGASGKQKWFFSGYTSLTNASTSTQRFPGTITFSDDRGVTAEIDIQSLAAVRGFVADEFTPPPGAKEVTENAAVIQALTASRSESVFYKFKISASESLR